MEILLINTQVLEHVLTPDGPGWLQAIQLDDEGTWKPVVIAEEVEIVGAAPVAQAYPADLVCRHWNCGCPVCVRSMEAAHEPSQDI